MSTLEKIDIGDMDFTVSSVRSLLGYRPYEKYLMVSEGLLLIPLASVHLLVVLANFLQRLVSEFLITDYRPHQRAL